MELLWTLFEQMQMIIMTKVKTLAFIIADYNRYKIDGNVTAK